MKVADRYHKWVEWSEEDHVDVGKCPDLITGIHGDDPIKLYRELCKVVEEIISHLQAVGKPLPDPRTHPIAHPK